MNIMAVATLLLRYVYHTFIFLFLDKALWIFAVISTSQTFPLHTTFSHTHGQ